MEINVKQMFVVVRGLTVLITSFSHVDTELTVVNKTCNSLTVMWTPIQGRNRYKHKYLWLEQASPIGNWTRRNTNESIFDITQLMPSTKYTMGVEMRINYYYKRKFYLKFKTLPRTGMHVY